MGKILFFIDKSLCKYINRVKIIVWISVLKTWIHLSISANRKTYFLYTQRLTAFKKNRPAPFCTITSTNIPYILFYRGRGIFATTDIPKFVLKQGICFFFYHTTNEFRIAPIRTIPGRTVGLTLWAE